MKEKNLHKSLTIEKFLLAFCTFSILTLCLLVLVYIKLLSQKNVATSAANLSINATDIQSPPSQLKNSYNLANLDILPTYYDTLTKNFGSFSSHELTTYLRYSEVLKTQKASSITDGYQFLEKNQLNTFVPQSYIDQYIIGQAIDISEQIIQQPNLSDSTKRYLNTTENTPLLSDIIKCLSYNPDKFLKKGNCQKDINQIDDEKMQPTLNFLFESLSTKTFSNQNDYDTYINNQLYMYQLAKKQDTTVENTTNINISNVYLDLNNDHIHKAQLIANYLTQAYKQLNLDNTQINNQISSLNSLIQTLDSYKYGDTIPSSIANFLSSSSLNISSDDNHLPLDNQIEFLVKSLDINGQTQTFVAPMYVFSSTDKKFPIPSLTFTINDDNFNEDYDVTPASQVKGTVRVPIFMYHQITQAPAGQNSFQTGLYVDPSDLEKEMAYLVKKNYKSITPLEYYNLLMSGENPTQKTVMITFDDGVENQYTNAYPILKKYDLTGVFYIIAQRSAITAAQSKEMSDNGMVIDSHSSTHVDLTKVTDPTQLSYEVISSKYALQTTTGKTVYSFAYPGCGWNSETVSYVTSAGYLLGMSCGSTIDNYPQYRLELSRVHAFGDMQSFKNLLSNVH